MIVRSTEFLTEAVASPLFNSRQVKQQSEEKSSVDPGKFAKFALDEIFKRDVDLSKLRLGSLDLESLEEIVKERRVMMNEEQI